MASFSDSLSNPRIKKLKKYVTTSTYGEETSSYRGVAAKTLFFAIIFAAGIGAFFYMHAFFGRTTEIIDGLLYPQELPILIGAIVVALISTIISALAPSTTAVTGTIYCACYGYLITFLSMSYAQQYKGIIVEALGLTILIVAVLAVLYTSGKIRVTNRFRTVVFTTLIVSIIGGVIFSLMLWLAPHSALTTSIIKMNNGPIGIVFAVIGVLIASAVLTMDFDNVKNLVESGLPKKYEWVAGFALITGVIYLYLKILQLLARIQNNKN